MGAVEVESLPLAATLEREGRIALDAVGSAHDDRSRLDVLHPSHEDPVPPPIGVLALDEPSLLLREAPVALANGIEVVVAKLLDLDAGVPGCPREIGEAGFVHRPRPRVLVAQSPVEGDGGGKERRHDGSSVSRSLQEGPEQVVTDTGDSIWQRAEHHRGVEHLVVIREGVDRYRVQATGGKRGP